MPFGLFDRLVAAIDEIDVDLKVESQYFACALMPLSQSWKTLFSKRDTYNAGAAFDISVRIHQSCRKSNKF